MNADKVQEGDSLYTSAGWCPVLAVHVMPKSVRIALLTPAGERAITPRRADKLTVR
jgi:hypothetical protein